MQAKLKDETGNRYTRLVVLERAPNKGDHVAWLCRCECGVESEALKELASKELGIDDLWERDGE